MAQISTNYGIATIALGETTIEVRATQPADDLIALAHEPHPDRVARIALTYGPVGLLPGKPWPALNPGAEAEAGRRFKAFSRTLRGWSADGRLLDFDQGAASVATGLLSASVRDDLGRVRFGPGATTAEVPDLFALGAWALMQAILPGHYQLQPCDLCAVPWFASQGARYCRRLAPGSSRQTCQQVGKTIDFRARKRTQQGGPHGQHR